MKRLITGLKRRQIYKFGVIYLAVAWLLIQIVVNVEEPLSLPGWMDTLVITLLGLGFPVGLLFAWTRETSARSAAAAEAAPARDHAGRQGIAPGALPRLPDAASTDGDEARVFRGDIRFCMTPGGHRLAWSRLGAGPPLLRTGNWVSHLEIEWTSPVHRPMLRDLASEFDLVLYDGRGTGLSDRDVSEFSLDTMVEDMETVADANHLDKFSIVAYSQSCAVAVAYAVRHPERVSRMLLYGGFLHNFRTAAEIDAMATLFAETWGQSNPATRQLFTTVLFPDSKKDEFEGFNELQREAISPETAALLFRACHAIDVRELAAQVTSPTLVVHSRYEAGVPLECSREAAALIPNARLVILDSRNHLVLEREPAYRQLIDETVAFFKANGH